MQNFSSNQEKQILLRETLEVYEFHVKEAIVDKMPLNTLDLKVIFYYFSKELTFENKAIHKRIRIAVYDYFHERFSYKEHFDEYVSLLSVKIKERLQRLEAENNEESSVLKKNYILK